MRVLVRSVRTKSPRNDQVADAEPCGGYRSRNEQANETVKDPRTGQGPAAEIADELAELVYILAAVREKCDKQNTGPRRDGHRRKRKSPRFVQVLRH